jgi:hypothetical protein
MKVSGLSDETVSMLEHEIATGLRGGHHAGQ